MGWTIDTESGMESLPEKRLQDLTQLLAILATECCISWKDLKRLVGMLRSMHLAVPGVVVHLYRIHIYLSQGGLR